MAYKYLNDDGLKAYTKKVKGALKDLHSTIAISSENTTESMAQNVKNIADYVEKAKAAGIEDVNGMAVTCIINDAYSGVGYIMGNTDVAILGIKITDDLVDNTVFIIYGGVYFERAVIAVGTSNKVDSDMLNEGARKPIILTPNTTEVDEETYQKLLSDDVDVMFKSSDGNYGSLTYKYDGDTNCKFYFTVLSAEGGSLADAYLYGYEMSINNTAPHKAIISTLFEMDIHTLIDNSGFINKAILRPVLQEIDLTGTDADRKAKLDKFKANWKTLTGASDLNGARFVGKMVGSSSGSIFTYSAEDNAYLSLAVNSENDNKIRKIFVSCRTGNLVVTDVFSYLEPLTIEAGGNSATATKNKFRIKRYTNNLTSLGLDTNKGYQASVEVTSNGEKYTGTLNIGTGNLLMGIVSDIHETHHYPFHVEVATGIVTFDKNNYFIEKTSDEVNSIVALKRDLGTLSSLNTESKTDLVSAINELAGKVAALEANATEVTNETTE